MGQFKPMVKMETTEPSVILKLKSGGHVNMKKGGSASCGHKAMGKADGGIMDALAGTPSLVGRPAMAAPVQKIGKPSMSARRKAMMAKPAMSMAPVMKEGGKADTAEDKAMVKKAFKQHDAQEHKNGKGTKLALKKGGKMATGGVVLGNGGGYKTGGVVLGNGGGYKTGGVVLGNGGGFKAGGKASKKAYAAGGTVNSGKPVAMPQGSKKPPSPVSISKLAGTYKKGGRATPAERREESAFNSENATAMRQSKADSNLKYGKGGAVTERDLERMEKIGDPYSIEMRESRLSDTGSISAEEARRMARMPNMKAGHAAEANRIRQSLMAGMRTPSGSGSISDAETRGYEGHYANERAENEADKKAMHDMMMYLPNKAADLFHKLRGQGSVTEAEREATRTIAPVKP
jgi:hypothetical protein